MKTKLMTLAALAILVFTQCKKETTITVSDEKANFLEQAKQFVKTKAPTADFDRLDWGNAIAYKKDDIYKIVRVPLTGNNQPGQKAVYLSYNNGQFSGNYFEMVNNTVTTLSLDNVRKCVVPVTGNGQVGNYTLYENGQQVQDVTGIAINPRPPMPSMYLYGDFNLYYAMNMLGLGQGYVGGELSGQTGTVSYLETPLEGGGGGGITIFSIQVASLAGWLSLSYEQTVWLQNNTARTDELIAYLQTSTNPLANTICLGHLTRMIADPGYFSFVQHYATNYGNQPMWWENPIYLEPFGEGPFGGWAINYLIQHPTVSMATFQNQFITLKEGKDGNDYDSVYWNNPSLTFPPQALPTYDSFNINYPKHQDPLYDTPEKMYNSVGGTILALYNNDPVNNNNTCALRISKALNYSGVTIPDIPEKTF